MSNIKDSKKNKNANSIAWFLIAWCVLVIIILNIIKPFEAGGWLDKLTTQRNAESTINQKNSETKKAQE